MSTSSRNTSARPIVQQHEPVYASPSSSEGDLSDGSASSYERLPPLAHCSRHHPSCEPLEAQPPAYATLESTASVNTYNSLLSETQIHVYDPAEGEEIFDDDDEDEKHEYFLPEDAAIPPVLPIYRHHPLQDHPVRPSTPQAFAELFPSLDRLSVKHDDSTADGNMNLRIETPLLLPVSRHQRPVAFQLFHLRMHDLARREFSLRRYCRDSGREICSSKRAFAEPAVNNGPPSPLRRPGTSGGSLQRSVSTAIRSVKTPFQRSSTASSLFKRPGTGGGRRGSTSSGRSGTWEVASRSGSSDKLSGTTAATSTVRLPTDTIKLEFSNYARVDVTRRLARSGATLYDFQWWGHDYAWRRVVDEHTDAVSYHLIRDGRGTAVAHIVPETRGLDQVRAEESAGGWIPPCHMWISDESIINAMTDVADVIIATGLMALVDDSIRSRWQVANLAQRPPRPVKSYTGDNGVSRTKSLIPSIFHRRQSEQYSSNPFKVGRPVAAY